MSFDIRKISVAGVRDLCERHHGYAGCSDSATYAFGVFEMGVIVAAYSWQPPPFGAAKSVCPEFPQGVLALSRMVAVPRNERRLKHVSKPLMAQMKKLIDRTRWPVLVTYSDSSLGHNGYVYQCSGWTKTESRKARIFVNAAGARASSYSNGRHGKRDLTFYGTAVLTRWEHWVCATGSAKQYAESHGWCVVPIEGKVWKSGRQAHRIIKV